MEPRPPEVKVGLQLVLFVENAGEDFNPSVELDDTAQMSRRSRVFAIKLLH